MADALYLPDGDTLVPTPLTVGPWAPTAQHGGPVAALLVRAVERTAAPGPFQLLRLTVELLRPAPLTPMELSTEITRAGRNVQVVDVRLRSAGVEIATARALRLRILDVEVPAQAPVPASPPVPTGPASRPEGLRGGFLDAVDFRFLEGGWDTVGPARLWGRLTVPVVAGEDTSPVQQLAAVADFGNGVSRIVGFETHTFINPDLTIALSRPPSGSWVGLDARTRLDRWGYGQAESLVFDGDGPVGRAVQTLLVTAR